MDCLNEFINFGEEFKRLTSHLLINGFIKLRVK